MRTVDRIRTTPRISVTKLGEYLVASPRRRRAILRAQHRPKDVVVARYHDARHAIVRFLTGELDEDGLIEERDRVASVTGGTDWAVQDRRLSVLAINRFLDIADRVQLHGNVRPGSGIHGALRIADVSVSIRPDVTFLEDVGSGTRLGSIKLVFARTIPITDESGAYIGTALAEHLGRHHPGSPVVREWCQVVDVLHGTVRSAPRTYRSRMADIEAACEEIGSSWSRVVRE